jgi:hypothetical protein
MEIVPTPTAGGQQGISCKATFGKSGNYARAVCMQNAGRDDLYKPTTGNDPNDVHR